MSATNEELIRSALVRVNLLTGKNGRLYHDNTGWFVIGLADESSRSATELLAYLHGIEDTFRYNLKNEQLWKQQM